MNRTVVSGAVESSFSLTDAVGTEALNMQRSSGINNNMRIPTSPMSFSSNSVNIPGSLVLDGSAASMQHLPQQQQQQLLQQQTGQGSVPMRENNYSHVDKKPRLEVKQEDMLQQQILQQLIQRQDPTGRNPQMQALLQQQRLRQHQQMLQSMSPSQRLQLQQQQQLRQQLQQQGTQQIPPNVRPYEVGVCARKLMMYLYHLQQRPAENCITYWRKFVAEYFSPRAKQRLCLSQYESAGHHALGMFPQAAPDMWQCDLCGTKSGKGFEATFDVLARLIEIKFASGIIDELLYLDHPRENRFPNGLMMLEYRKAVQETVHEQFRVVREGHLRIIFSQDLKILSWEFCARRHEELLLRRLIAPQVNQLLQVAQKCQSTISESGSEGVSQQDLQSNSNMVLGAGRQLAKFMELQSLNDLGYPKRYIRTLQISEVVKSMKDLMNFTGEQKIGPIEGLKRLLEQTVTVKLQKQKMQEMEQFGNNGAINGPVQAQMVLTSGTMNGSTGNNTNNHHQIVGRGAMSGPAEGQMVISSGTVSGATANNNSNNHHQIVGRGAMNGSAQAAAALTNYQSMLMRQNAMNNPNSNTGKQEGFSSQNPTPNSNQSPSSSSQQRHNLVTGGFPNSPQMQQQQRTMNGPTNILPQNHPHQLQSPHSHGNTPEQQMLHQLLQEMSENGGSVQQQQAFSGQSGSNSNAERNTTASTSNISGGGRAPSRNNSFKAASNNNLHFSEDISITDHDFSEDGFFNNNDIYGGL
ncbi:putative LIM-domain binding protein/SEUSS [Arabidopsis thaliana]|uniref:SLK1 n=3 Tax=Arabidopsis TaxID=3701 RepID=A0A178UY11_ARATH|nr:LIM-domain binding protein/SEUSS [Arabidopsis thaliana x Arabidopsis arenosa]KAG7617304.1 LIM-domain binding protein/SEUSS [Arabidopsis thaliana x Arabidopsis arenosa]KAG7621770.1 LIM-domain binding protein/SEUSS [Arabidopsis suecica]KAG7621771.1 LIM-domain binding protein/SEUSS [Arabidopsis suecica]OAO98859.1 SLK1 [Arabidopsis thaliana]